MNIRIYNEAMAKRRTIKMNDPNIAHDSEPARICLRMARSTQSDLKSTVLGYCLMAALELGTYANASMVRHADLNDDASDMMAGVLAIGDALHASGTQVMVGIILA